MTRKLHINEQYFVNLIVISLIGITPLIMIPGAYDVYYTPKLYFVYFISTLSLIYLYIKRDTITFDWVDKLLGLFIGILFISSLLGIDIHNSFIGNMTDREPFLLYLCYFVNFLVISKKFRMSKKVLNFLFLCSAIICLYGLIQYFGFNPIKLDRLRRNHIFTAMSTLGYRNAIGAYVSIFLPIAISMYIYINEKKYLAVTVVLLCGLISSETRSSWVSLAVYMAILLFLCIKDKKRLLNWGVILATIIVTFGVINFSKGGSINSRLLSIARDAALVNEADNEMAGTGRVYIWKNGIKLLSDKPLLGYGVDNFGNAFLSRYSDQEDFMIKNLGGVVSKAHNEYLEILINNGIFAIILYLSILLIILSKTLIGGIKDKNAYLIALGLSIVGYCIQAFFNISIICVAPAFWGVLAVGYGLVKEKEYNFSIGKWSISKYISGIDTIEVFSFLIMGGIPIVILPNLTDRFYEPKIILVYIVIMMTMLFIYDREKWRNNTIIDYLIATFIILILLSTVFSMYVPASISGKVDRREGFLAISAYCMILLIMYKHFKYSNKMFDFINIFICIISVYGVLQYLGLEFIPAYYLKSKLLNTAYSTIGNKEFLAALLTLYLPINTCFYLKKGEKKYLIFSGLVFAGLTAANSKSNWLALFFCGVVILGYSLKKKIYLKKYIASLAVLLGVFITLNLFANGATLIKSGSNISNLGSVVSKNNELIGNSKLYIWKRGITLISENPFLGSGPDTFGVIFLDKYFDELQYMQKVTGSVVDKANNEYLQLAVTCGIPALIVYIALTVFICVGLMRKMRKDKGSDQLLYLGVLLSVIAYMIQAFFNISVVSVAPVFWAMLGIGANIGGNELGKLKNNLDTN